MYKLIITEFSCKIGEFNRMIRSIKGRNTRLKKSISYRTKSTNNQDIKYILQPTTPVKILMLSTSLRKNLHLFSPINQKRFINTIAKGNFPGARGKVLTTKQPVCKCSFCTQYQKFYWNSSKLIDVNKELMLENEIAYFKKSITYLQEQIFSFFNEQIAVEEALTAIDDSVLNCSSSRKEDNKPKKLEGNNEKKIPAQMCAKKNRKVTDHSNQEKKILAQESAKRKAKARKYFSTKINRIAQPDLHREKPPKFVISKYKFISTEKQIKKPKMKPIKLQNNPITNRNVAPQKLNDILTTIRIAFDLIKKIGENKIRDIKRQIKKIQAKIFQRNEDLEETDELKKDNVMQMKKEDGATEDVVKEEQNKDEGTKKNTQQLNEKPHIEKIRTDLKTAIESNYRETFGNTFKKKSEMIEDAKKTAKSKKDLKGFDEVTTKHKCLITLRSMKQDIKKREPNENRMYNLKNHFGFNMTKNESNLGEKSKSNVTLKSTKSAETPQKEPDTIKSETSTGQKSPIEKSAKSDTAIQTAKTPEIDNNQSTQNQNLKPPFDKDSLIPEETKSTLTIKSFYQEDADDQYKRSENVESACRCQKKGNPDDKPGVPERTKSILTLNSFKQDPRTQQGEEKPKTDIEQKDLLEQINKEIQASNESKSSVIDYKATSMKGIIDELNNDILQRLKPENNRKAATDVKKSASKTKQSKINTEVKLDGIRDDLDKEICNKYASKITNKSSITSEGLSIDGDTPEVSSKPENETRNKPTINAISNETKMPDDIKTLKDDAMEPQTLSKKLKDHLSQSVEENPDYLDRTLDEMQKKKSSSTPTNWLVSKKIFSGEVAKNNKKEDDLSLLQKLNARRMIVDKLDVVKMKQDMLNDLRYEQNPAERLMKMQGSEDNIEDKLERPSITPQPNPPPKKEDERKRKAPPAAPKNSMILPPRNTHDNPKLESRMRSKLPVEESDKDLMKQAKDVDKPQEETSGDGIKRALQKGNENIIKEMDEAKAGEAFEFQKVEHKNTVLLLPKGDPKSPDKKNILNNINIDAIEELEIQYKDGSDKNLIKIAEEMDKVKNKEKDDFLSKNPPKMETMEGSIKAVVTPTRGNLASSYQLEGVFKIHKTISTPDNNSPTSTKPDPKKNWSNPNQLKGSLNIKDQGQKKTNPVKKYSDLAGNKLHDNSIITCEQPDSLVEETVGIKKINNSCLLNEDGISNQVVMCSKKDDDKSNKNNKKDNKNKRNKFFNKPESFHKEKKSDRLIPKLIKRRGSIIVKEQQPKKSRPTLTVVYTKKNRRRKLDNRQTNKKRKEEIRRKRKSRVRKRRRNVILFMLKDELKKSEQERFKAPAQPVKKSVTPEEQIEQTLSKYKFKTPTEVANDFSGVPMSDMERNRQKRSENMKKRSFYRNLDKRIFSKGKANRDKSVKVGGKGSNRQQGVVKEGTSDGKSNAVMTEDEEDNSDEPKSVHK
ncbi:unnamed protein product [Phyllotreta striolata]|uniref:Uncharacterized protein n=1 Tax=Phyllotreta striolata TaxID=444603 RepID=A0A9N9XN66_PHYSR|nr:unnamed protein product [Phyllotreta striolata]